MANTCSILFNRAVVILALFSCTLCRSESSIDADNKSNLTNAPVIQREGLFKVMGVGGRVFLSKNEIDWEPAKVSNLFEPKTIIKTESRSHVIVHNSSFRQITRIGEKSTITVEKYLYDKNGLIKTIKMALQEGSFAGEVKSGKIVSELEVSTAAGIAARIKNNRKTQYVISAKGEVSVYSGRAEVTYTDAKGNPKKISVTKGRMFFPSENEKPAKVDRIPADKDESRFFKMHDHPIGKP